MDKRKGYVLLLINAGVRSSVSERKKSRRLLHCVQWHPVITLASKRVFRVLLLELIYILHIKICSLKKSGQLEKMLLNGNYCVYKQKTKTMTTDAFNNKTRKTMTTDPFNNSTTKMTTKDPFNNKTRKTMMKDPLIYDQKTLTVV